MLSRCRYTYFGCALARLHQDENAKKVYIVKAGRTGKLHNRWLTENKLSEALLQFLHDAELYDLPTSQQTKTKKAQQWN